MLILKIFNISGQTLYDFINPHNLPSMFPMLIVVTD